MVVVTTHRIIIIVAILIISVMILLILSIINSFAGSGCRLGERTLARASGSSRTTARRTL
jgi:hypothetical protein